MSNEILNCWTLSHWHYSHESKNFVCPSKLCCCCLDVTTSQLFKSSYLMMKHSLLEQEYSVAELTPCCHVPPPVLGDYCTGTEKMKLAADVFFDSCWVPNGEGELCCMLTKMLKQNQFQKLPKEFGKAFFVPLNFSWQLTGHFWFFNVCYTLLCCTMFVKCRVKKVWVNHSFITFLVPCMCVLNRWFFYVVKIMLRGKCAVGTSSQTSQVYRLYTS